MAELVYDSTSFAKPIVKYELDASRPIDIESLTDIFCSIDDFLLTAGDETVE